MPNPEENLIMDINEEINDEIKEEIRSYLKTLFSIYGEVTKHPQYNKQVSEKIGMLMMQASKTVYKQTFCEYLESNNNSDYMYLKKYAPLCALEGYGHFLRALGNNDVDQARNLSITFAQNVTNEITSAEQLQSLKRQIAELKEKVVRLEKENANVNKRFKATEDKDNNSNRLRRAFEVFLR